MAERPQAAPEGADAGDRAPAEVLEDAADLASVGGLKGLTPSHGGPGAVTLRSVLELDSALYGQSEGPKAPIVYQYEFSYAVQDDRHILRAWLATNARDARNPARLVAAVQAFMFEHDHPCRITSTMIEEVDNPFGWTFNVLVQCEFEELVMHELSQMERAGLIVGVLTDGD